MKRGNTPKQKNQAMLLIKLKHLTPPSIYTFKNLELWLLHIENVIVNAGPRRHIAQYIMATVTQ